MATGKEWYDYFAKLSTPKLRIQVKIIDMIFNSNIDKKIIDEFQLTYVEGVKHIITGIINSRGRR